MRVDKSDTIYFYFRCIQGWTLGQGARIGMTLGEDIKRDRLSDKMQLIYLPAPHWDDQSPRIWPTRTGGQILSLPPLIANRWC